MIFAGTSETALDAAENPYVEKPIYPLVPVAAAMVGPMIAATCSAKPAMGVSR